MAIDPRISLGVRTPDASQAINIFENALMNSQTRDLRAAQEARAAELAPFNLQQAQQTSDINQQTLNQNRDAQRIQNLHQTGQRLKPFLAANDAQGAQKFLLDNISAIQTRIEQGSGEDVTESMETLAKLQAGDLQGVMGDINAIEGLVLGVSGGQTAGQREFNSLLNIAQDPKSTQLEKDSALRSLGDKPRAASASAKTVDVGGVPHIFDPIKQTLVPAVVSGKDVTTETVSTSEADIAGAVQAAKETAKDESVSGKKGIEKAIIDIDETKFKNAEKRDQIINAKNARRKEADAAILQIDDLLTGDRFSNAFGKVVTTTPELLRSQESIDAIADVNQIKGLITLESRQKLKGQGTITDSEQKILAQSATVLDNPLISDERARRELRKIKRVFEDASDRNQLKRETKDRIDSESAIEAKGEGQIMTDASGNRARVFADGTFEEL